MMITTMVLLGAVAFGLIVTKLVCEFKDSFKEDSDVEAAYQTTFKTCQDSIGPVTAIMKKAVDKKPKAKQAVKVKAKAKTKAKVKAKAKPVAKRTKTKKKA